MRLESGGAFAVAEEPEGMGHGPGLPHPTTTVRRTGINQLLLGHPLFSARKIDIWLTDDRATQGNNTLWGEIPGRENDGKTPDFQPTQRALTKAEHREMRQPRGTKWEGFFDVAPAPYANACLTR